MEVTRQKYRYCCRCKDKQLSQTYTACLGYRTVHLQLKEDGILNYTCDHCGSKDKKNHENFKPIEVNTHYLCEHAKKQLEKKEKIEINMIKAKSKNTKEDFEYLLRCIECKRKKCMDDEEYIDAMVQDNIEYNGNCYDPHTCEDDEEA